jgi:hypothetical protein
VQRITNPSAIEARLLDLAHTTDVKLTAPALAYFAPCSIADAQRVLDDLAAREVVGMNVDDNGLITYELRGRQRFAPPPSRATHYEAPPLALAPRSPSPPSALLAGLLSFWIPGAGQLYAGRVAAAVLWFLAVGAGYALILPGLVLHLFCIVSAISSARLQAPRPPQLLAARSL